MRILLCLLYCSYMLIACQVPGKNKHTPSITDTAYGTKNACLFSQIAYASNVDEKLKQYLPQWRLVWEGKSIGGNYAFIATNGEGFVLAIRGSLLEFSWDAFKNWVYQDFHVTTFKAWPHTNDSSKARIAAGAWDGWQNLCQMTDKSTGKTMLAFLQENIKASTPLLITGHSLGGNLAIVYGSYFWQQMKLKKTTGTNINVISFASPAAGNTSFAEDFNKKFPKAIRYENRHDLVPKFPCIGRVASLGELYDSIPSASSITVSYNNMTISLSDVFWMLNTSLRVLSFSNDSYLQTSGKGELITVPLSGKNNRNDISTWLAEAGYQHGMEQYARQLDVPVIDDK